MMKRYSLAYQCLILSVLLSCSSQPTKPNVDQTEVKKPEEKKDTTPVAISTETQAKNNEEALAQSYKELKFAQQAIYDSKIDEAVKMLKVIVQRNPEIAEAHYNLGILEERLGVFQEARNYYLKAIESKKDFSPAWLALSMLYFKNNDFQGALSEVDTKLQSDPNNIGIKNARIRILLNFPGKEEEIIREAKLILREDEQNVEAMISLASAYDLQKKYELAIAILENAKELAPNHPEIFARLSRCYEALGEHLKARLILEEAVNAPAGGTAEIHNQLGLIYHIAGDYIGASDQFQKALSLWPTMIEAQINLGNALKGQQKYIEASQAFQQALLIKPNLPEAYYNLGILYLDGQFENIPNKIDQLKQAISYLNDYLKNPKDQDQERINALIKEGERLMEVEKKKQEQAKPSAEPTPPPAEPTPPPAEPTPPPAEPTPPPAEPTPPPAEPTPPPAEPTPPPAETKPTTEAQKPSEKTDAVVEEVLEDPPAAPTKPKEEKKIENKAEPDKTDNSNQPKPEPKKEEVQDVEL
jgi:tetratricopeptide (TPR) repeat protein